MDPNDSISDSARLDWIECMPNERMNRAVDLWRTGVCHSFREAIDMCMAKQRIEDRNEP